MAAAGRLRVASWNVNGIRARFTGLLDWLRDSAPDVALLQETKIQDAQFPREALEDAGYNIAHHGQKSFNGVAILSRFPLEDVVTGLPGDADDTQARWISATVFGDGRPLRVCCFYAPNGNPVPGPKFNYKHAWMQRLQRAAETLRAGEEAVLLGGDANVIADDADAAQPEDWREDALGRPETRAAWRRLLHAGWTDAVRVLNPEPGLYSFWDYQGGAWRQNRGIRIDHLLLSPQAADRLQASGIERDLRARPKPSDHVPVWCELKP